MGENDQKTSLPLNEVKAIVDTLKENGINHVTLTTMEPLCYPDIVKFLKYCRFNHIYVSITTNGTLFSDEVLEEIYKGGVDRVLISLEGLSKTTNDFIRGNGVYDTVVGALEKFEELNMTMDNVIRPIVQINLSTYNREELCNGLIDFLDRFKYVEVVIGNLIGFGRAKNEESLLLGFKGYKECVFELIGKISKTGHKNSVGFKELMPYEIVLINLIFDINMSFSIPQCSIFKSNGYGILPDGRLCRCNILMNTGIIPNEELLLDYDIEKATKNGVALLDSKYAIKKRPFCNNCKWINTCNVCMLYTKDNEIDSELVALCEKAAKAIESVKEKIKSDSLYIHFKENILITYDNEKVRISDDLGNYVLLENTGNIVKKINKMLLPAKNLYSEIGIDEKILDDLIYSNLLKVDGVTINEIYD